MNAYVFTRQWLKTSHVRTYYGFLILFFIFIFFTLTSGQQYLRVHSGLLGILIDVRLLIRLPVFICGESYALF